MARVAFRLLNAHRFRMTSTVLLVHADPDVAARLGQRLAWAGYPTTAATTFEEARSLLAAGPPTLLIASVRLGAFNGLQLIIRTRLDSPRTATLVITDTPDPVVEAEAAKIGAHYLAEPECDDRLVAAATRLMSGTAV